MSRFNTFKLWGIQNAGAFFLFFFFEKLWFSSLMAIFVQTLTECVLDDSRREDTGSWIHKRKNCCSACSQSSMKTGYLFQLLSSLSLPSLGNFVLNNCYGSTAFIYKIYLGTGTGTVKPVFATTWEIGTNWELRTATPVPRPIHYTGMDLRNRTTSELRTVFRRLGCP